MYKFGWRICKNSQEARLRLSDRHLAKKVGVNPDDGLVMARKDPRFEPWLAGCCRRAGQPRSYVRRPALIQLRYRGAVARARDCADDGRLMREVLDGVVVGRGCNQPIGEVDPDGARRDRGAARCRSRP